MAVFRQDNLNSHKVGEVFGVVTVEEISDLTVTRNLAGTEEAVAVGAGGLLVHAALEVEKGGGWKKKPAREQEAAWEMA